MRNLRNAILIRMAALLVLVYAAQFSRAGETESEVPTGLERATSPGASEVLSEDTWPEEVVESSAGFIVGQSTHLSDAWYKGTIPKAAAIESREPDALAAALAAAQVPAAQIDKTSTTETARRSDEPVTQGELKSVQRVNQITPAPAAESLFNSNLNSAAEIAVVRQERIETLRALPVDALFKTMSADQLSHYIVDQQSFANSMSAVQEALARGGIDIADGESPGVPGYSPRTPLPVTTVELVKLTIEQRNRACSYTLSVQDLAEGLAKLGWPFSDNSSVGKQLQAFIAKWIEAARHDPSNIHSFAPLFIEQSARRQSPTVDLSKTDVDAGAIRLTLLDMELFAAAIERLRVPRQSAGFDEPAVDPVLRLAAFSAAPLVALASVSSEPIRDPCGTLKAKVYKSLGLDGPIGRQAGDFVVGDKAGSAAGKVLEWFGYTDEQVGHILGAAGILSQLNKLLGLYQHLALNITVDPRGAHKALVPGETAMFRADIAIPELPTPNSGDQVARRCLAAAGLPDFREAQEQIAESMSGYAVEWHLTQGSPEHAVDSRWNEQPNAGPQVKDVYHQGRVRTGMTRSGGDGRSFYSRFKVDIKTESREVHPALFNKAPVVACAELDTTSVPGAPTIVNALTGAWGMAGTIVELISGMFQKAFKPKGCCQLEVTFCEKYSVIVQENRTLHGCEPDICAKGSVSTEIVVPLHVSEGGETFTGTASEKKTLAIQVTGPALRGTAEADEWLVAQVTGSTDPLTPVAHLKVALSTAHTPTDATMIEWDDGVVRRRDATAPSRDGDCDVWMPMGAKGCPCEHEMCTGFELPLTSGPSGKQWTFTAPGGVATGSIKVSLRKE